MFRGTFLALIYLTVASSVCTGIVAPQSVMAQSPESFDFFEQSIRPLLIDHCAECHGSETQWNEFRVDLKKAFFEGGASGAVVVPGHPEESLIVTAIRRQGDYPMPPDDPLSDSQIEAIEQWIRDGAPWPDDGGMEGKAEDVWGEHWAYQPVRSRSIPEVPSADWVQTPIDAFVLERLSQEELLPAPRADRRTLIRRVTFDLTGLPPAPEEVEAFVQDNSPDSYTRLVERLLDSPAYGEHWARLWLDVARYSDTKGYVYGREEKNFIHAYVYRDWVVEALQNDLPYDQFVRLQLAADQITEPGDPDRAAMGFLTLGRRFLGVSHDIIDDRIDVMSRGLMGMTVSCARCHDHKYDPIPTAEYYSMYGVFHNSTERLERLDGSQGSPEWEAEYAKRLQAFDDARRDARQVAADRMRSRFRDYWIAQTELEKYPQEGFDQILSTEELIPNLVRRLQAFLVKAQNEDDPRFRLWHAYAAIPKDQFASRAQEVWDALRERPEDQLTRPTNAFFLDGPPESLRQVAEAYGDHFGAILTRWQKECDDAKASGESLPEAMSDPVDESWRQFLYGSSSPCEIPDETMMGIEGLFDSNTCNSLWNLQNELERWILQAPVDIRFVIGLKDRSQDLPAQVFRRGNPANRGDIVPRQMFASLVDESVMFNEGSGRRELAEQITSPENPLTSRVWVNRLWKQYFGEGLVRTPSDFGLRAQSPSHPELLDWLAKSLIDSGWRTKEIHRLIVQSATYQQAGIDSHVPEMRVQGIAKDPGNQWLWYYRPKRLSFEAMRDSMLAISGELSSDVGGRAVPLFVEGAGPKRRTLYGSIDRQFVPSVLRMFDFANPDLHAPQRSDTTVPQQSLFAMNHPFVAGRAKSLVSRLFSDTDRDEVNQREYTNRLFDAVFQRIPSDSEMDAMLRFVKAFDEPEAALRRAESMAWSYGYGPIVVESTSEDSNAGPGVRLESFTPLPYFNGTAWQGGPQFPDGALGWLQLTAEGGHPGNTLEHAVVRRWTAPRTMQVQVRSTVNHEEEPGDGIRCWVLAQGTQTLAHSLVHHSMWEWTSEPMEIQEGQMLDFIVDIREVLNTDQYLWRVVIEESQADGTKTDGATLWDSQKDFDGPLPQRLDAWEQLAQVLLISNEAMFIQ